MAPPQLLLPLLIISSSLVLISADTTLPRPPALDPSILKTVNSICSQTDYKIVCVTSATFFAGAYDAITPESLLEMHIRLATDRLQSAKEMAEEMVDNAEGKKQGALKDCANLYDSMLDCFTTALKAAKEGDWGTASSNLSSVFSLSTSCESSFTDADEANPMDKKTKFLKKITSNALAILTNLQSKGSN